MYSLHKIKIRVKNPFITRDFTGKFVKSLLIEANPALKDVFENPSYPTPKPIRISPLLLGEEKFPRVAVYPKTFDQKKGVSPLEIKGDYYFLIGINSDLDREYFSLFELFHVAIANLFAGINIKYGNFDVFVKAIGYKQLDVQFPKNFKILKIKFISPSLFKDPFSRIARVKDGTFKRFMPIPPYIFSLNVYELMREKYSRSIIRLGYAFYESYNNLETVKRIFYSYDGKLLPGVVGYAKFFKREKMREEVLEDFMRILIHAQIMGIGTGRANGFGYTIIETK